MSMDQAQREFEAYRKDDSEARAILDSAATEGRSTTAEEDERFEKLLTSARFHLRNSEEFSKSAQRASEVERMIGETVAAPAVLETASASVRRDADLIANMRAVVDGHRKGQDAGELTTEAFLRSSDELRALADFSDGGSLYVNDFYAQVQVYMRTLSPWIATATVINGTDGRPLLIPAISADPTTYSPGEGTAITESTPTVGSAVATPVAYKALAYISQELTEDEMVNMLPYIARTQGRSLGLQAGSAFTSTIVTAATNGGTATGKGGGGGTSGTALSAYVGYEDLLDLKYGMAVPYRVAGSWFMSNSAIKTVRKFKDGLGNYLWQPALTVGQPDMFDGRPVYEDPFLATLASASKSILFGDPSAVIVKQLPLRVSTSDQFRFNTDQIAIKAVYRAGNALPDAAAVRYLVSANS